MAEGAVVGGRILYVKNAEGYLTPAEVQELEDKGRNVFTSAREGRLGVLTPIRLSCGTHK